ncbi:LysR family transcriptional regulator [Pseudomonas kitaguniensis]|uniref:LysR family transcriptional regulator n=1 Tax=Pseudomonas kitaguniensis TaxID=2607908 RepID=UPI003D0839B6
MNTNDLQTFLQVVRHGSFAAAARALSLDPSSVSRAIAALEEELGTRIFQRTTRRLRLTESGSAIAERVSRALEELDEARQVAQQTTGEVRGRLRLSAPNTFGVERLVPLLPAFCREHPALEIDLVFNDAIVDLVAEGIDLAVRLAPLRDSTLVAVPILDIKYHVVASPKWIDQHRSELGHPGDLEGFPCLSLILPGRDRWLFCQRKLSETIKVLVHPHCAASNGVALRQLALAGLGPAMLADWLVEEEIASGRLAELFPEYDASLEHAPVKAWVVYPTRSRVPAKVQVFAEYLQASLRG